MNAEALAITIQTKVAHFYSRSRNKLWKKGEDSGNVLTVVEMRTDCDQDVVALRVTVGGDGVACHTGAQSCFYRAIELGSAALPSDAGHPRLTRVAQPVVR
jgi:phosphoribosyl-AMP cyclohydrolase